METVFPFPEMSGTEEETRLNFIDQKDVLSELSSDDLHDILRGIDKICPTLPSNDEFRDNGSRTYLDGRGIELATPEVDNPIDQFIYVKAGVRLLLDAITNQLSAESSATGAVRSALMQRRVVDNDGNTWGVHDNLSIRSSDYVYSVDKANTDTGLIWNGYLRTRNFITGALRVEKIPTFSQKLSVEHIYSQKSFNNSLIFADAVKGPRLEIRSNDTNLQEWAFLSRVGGAALLLAATQTRLLDQLAVPYRRLHGQNERAWNIIPLDENLDLYPAAPLLSAIELQYDTMSTILNQLEDHIDQPIPEHYRQIGEGILQFCEDIEATAFGESALSSLVGRADWAGKLSVVREHIGRQPSGRWMGDTKSKLLDLWYDQIVLSAEPDEQPTIAYGYGYKQADAASSQSYDHAVEMAMHFPPSNTRAALRVATAKKLGDKVKSCTWDRLDYQDTSKKYNEEMIEHYFSY